MRTAPVYYLRRTGPPNKVSFRAGSCVLEILLRSNVDPTPGLADGEHMQKP